MTTAAETERARLVARLREPTLSETEAEPLWAEIGRAGTPLVTASPHGADRREVTFVWREPEPYAAVYLRLNRVTDKDRAAQGVMRRAGTSPLWWLTLDLDARMCASYALCPIPAGADVEAEMATLGKRGARRTFRSDPANPARLGAGAEGTSVLRLDRAPAQVEWQDQERGEDRPERPVSVPAGTLSMAESPVPLAGRTRRLWTYLPAPEQEREPEPTGLLVLFDAEAWFGSLGLAHALDTAIGSGRVAPFAVLGVESGTTADRVDALGPRSRDLVADLAADSLPRLRRAHPEIPWGGREMTVVAGQSLGGITALVAALDVPEAYGAVLSHSTSMWWRPDRPCSPADLPAGGPFWVTDRFAAEPVADVRIRLAAGTEETGLADYVGDLGETLHARGWDASVRTYVGGHDFAWWRGALIDDLAALFPGPTPPASPE